jgi:ABC-2 type transport system permease protein
VTGATETGEHAILTEIRGPSALGGGARRFWDLLWLTARTEFKLGYHGTFLGFAWSFARPLLLFAILLAVFTKVFRLGSEVENYAPMLLLNILLFQFFSQATEQASTSVVRSESVVRKMQFPRLAIPLSVVLTNLLQLGLSLVVVFGFIVVYGVDPVWTWLLFPVALVALIILTTAMAMLLATLFVWVRDIGIIWSVSATALFYGAPILYPFHIIQDSTFADVILLNPLTPLFLQIREWVFDPDAPGAVEAAHGSELLLVIPIAIALAICVAAPIAFTRAAPRVAEEL